ncbi:MAG: heme ABC exporter ATP-binding protein CcmA [Rhodospirillales bacterium]|nr:heme ABC exporter ATP-binding protein CcmA [Rhodospirillales bacterium]
MAEFTGNDLTCIRGERVVFAKLAFAIGEGEVLYLRGPNGSGKSTLLRLMAGLLRPVGGQILWNGESTLEDAKTFRGLLHYVGHQDAIKTALTVEENLTFWAEMSGVDPAKRSVGEALENFSLSHLASLPARFLSAGQRKRLNLARICASPAPLWLLDEPANSLDKASVDALRSAITAHQEKGGLVAVATHEELSPESDVLDISEFTNNMRAPKENVA